MQRRFVIENKEFRVTKSFSYEMACEAFCKGTTNYEGLIGKTVNLQTDTGSYTFVVIEAGNRIMPVKKGFVQRTYVTLVKEIDEKRQIRYYWQRNRRGFDSSETWDLSDHILDFLVPRLERFAIAAKGHGWHDNEKLEDGGEITKKILKGFRIMQESEEFAVFSEKEVEDINESFRLFEKFFWDLWT